MINRKYFLFLALGASLSCSTIVSAQEEDPMCSQEMLMAYYPGQFVSNTLERFNIPQEKREGIIRDLAMKDREVVPMVEQKAERMNPNPLRDPQLRQEAVKIFRNTLYDLFASVMQNHGITDQEQIMQMLDDVQQQKAKQFATCMEKFSPDQSDEMQEYEQEQEGYERRDPRY